jgi:hypothetical protein
MFSAMSGFRSMAGYIAMSVGHVEETQSQPLTR